MIKSLMKLFGELFNFGLLAHAVIRLCIKKLLMPIENAEEVDVECFCTLMKTAGAKLESTQEGIDIADKFMKGLEVLIDQGKAESFCEKIKNMIGELFFLRVKQWTEVEVEAPAIPEIFQNNEMIAEAKANKEFLIDLRAAVSKVEKSQDWLDFMHPFRELKVWNEERLKGSVQILARHAMTNPKQAPMLALVCRKLADITVPAADARESKTFLCFLKDFCDQEKAHIRTNAESFRSFRTQVQALKKCTEESKFRQQKDELLKKLETHERPKNFVNFFGELFNAEVIESAEVLNFFVALMSADTVSDVSIECFCSLFSIVASKMLTEPNRKTLMKSSVVKLSKLVSTDDFSMKARQLVDDLEKTAHFRFELHTGFGPPTSHKLKQPIRLTTTLSTENLWTPGKSKNTQLGLESTPDDFFKKYLPSTVSFIYFSAIHCLKDIFEFILANTSPAAENSKLPTAWVERLRSEPKYSRQHFESGLRLSKKMLQAHRISEEELF